MIWFDYLLVYYSIYYYIYYYFNMGDYTDDEYIEYILGDAIDDNYYDLHDNWMNRRRN